MYFQIVEHYINNVSLFLADKSKNKDKDNTSVTSLSISSGAASNKQPAKDNDTKDTASVPSVRPPINSSENTKSEHEKDPVPANPDAFTAFSKDKSLELINNTQNFEGKEQKQKEKLCSTDVRKSSTSSLQMSKTMAKEKSSFDCEYLFHKVSSQFIVFFIIFSTADNITWNNIFH